MSDFSKKRLPDFTYANVRYLIAGIGKDELTVEQKKQDNGTHEQKIQEDKKRYENLHFIENVITRGLGLKLPPGFSERSKPVRRNYLHKYIGEVLKFVEMLLANGEVLFAPCEINDKFPRADAFTILRSPILNIEEKKNELNKQYPRLKGLDGKIEDLRNYLLVEDRYKYIDAYYDHKRATRLLMACKAQNKNCDGITVPPEPKFRPRQRKRPSQVNSYRAYVIYKEQAMCLAYSFTGNLREGEKDPYALKVILNGITYLEFKDTHTAQSIKDRITRVQDLAWFNAFVHKNILPIHLEQKYVAEEYYTEYHEDKYLLSILDEDTKWKALLYSRFFGYLSYLDYMFGDNVAVDLIADVHEKIVASLKCSSQACKLKNVATGDGRVPFVSCSSGTSLPIWFSELVDELDPVEKESLKKSALKIDEVVVLYWHCSKFLKRTQASGINKSLD